ncbi:MAG TPA: acetyl-CoA carboxylase biotin carboxyl carrier protein subunit [Caulobacteraceae bacterium]|nr:acetyl-CoA carboxylase biotin carboxyl carrier protein subunit [Caulobacteraceae bacterium]
MDVRSEINGTVWKVEVTLGDAVAEDDVLIILESMKMEVPVTAPVAGRVRELRVGEGDSVKEDQVVVVLETD